MIEIPYGRGFVQRVPLVDPTTDEFQTGATLAAADATIGTEITGFTTLSAESAAFTSGGTEIPREGDTLTGVTSAETCVVVGHRLTGAGTWGAGTGAGKIIVSNVSGAFTPGENLNNTSTGTANVLTLTADFAAIAITELEKGWYLVGCTAGEAASSEFEINLLDAEATWRQTGFTFKTFGHPLAADPRAVAYAGTVTDPSTDIDASGTWIDLPLTTDAESPGNNDDINGAWIEITDDNGVTDGAYIEDYTASTGRCLLRNTLRYDLTGSDRLYYSVMLERTVPVDVAAISKDTTAADNLELDYDGTGYAKTNSTIGLLADAIAAAKIATGALTADAFAADAIVAATLATGAITADAFAADAIVAATFATDSITSDALAASAAAKITDDFETQSQADPTGFHVNVMEVNSVDLTGDGVGTPIGAA